MAPPSALRHPQGATILHLPGRPFEFDGLRIGISCSASGWIVKDRSTCGPFRSLHEAEDAIDHYVNGLPCPASC
ncbi:hypothetical protein EJB05_46439, partial [Eragrostis curvula]